MPAASGPGWLTARFPQITVAASVSFAYYWLMPRLERHSEAFPDIDLRVLASDQIVDLSRDEADVAILYGATVREPLARPALWV